ncbi:MAG: arylmalonate decarboxylase [Proteobacteria bacterium]|nr:arylmalonate decarboxylase [Pseudomonadota bacterium]
MTDSLGWRRKFGVVAPSTNTSVQPEYDDMRPRGVTNHFARITIPDTAVRTDAEFLAMMHNIRGATEAAIDSVMTCSPDYVVMGMSAETFWDGAEGADVLHSRMEKRAGVGVALGSHAVLAALRAYGSDIRRISVITPYMPVGDSMVRKFFTDNGFEIAALEGLKCASPMLIAHETPARLRQAIRAVDAPDVQAVVQVGTNLACAAVATAAERWLDKPVIAINTATYWYALRQNGIQDRLDGFGSLLLDY